MPWPPAVQGKAASLGRFKRRSQDNGKDCRLRDGKLSKADSVSSPSPPDFFHLRKWEGGNGN